MLGVGVGVGTEMSLGYRILSVKTPLGRGFTISCLPLVRLEDYGSVIRMTVDNLWPSHGGWNKCIKVSLSWLDGGKNSQGEKEESSWGG